MICIKNNTLAITSFKTQLLHKAFKTKHSACIIHNYHVWLLTRITKVFSHIAFCHVWYYVLLIDIITSSYVDECLSTLLYAYRS